MSIVLSDGTVIPSYLGVSSSDEYTPGSAFTFNEFSLRVGRIVAAYSPDNKDNLNKKVIEYDVLTQQSQGSGVATDILYPRVIVASTFGGVADYFKWTPRIANYDPQKSTGLGSRVLLLCISGNTRFAYIIGGINHPDDTRKDAPFKNDHRLQWEFNGAHVYINNDGEFYFVHRGPTNADGKPKDEQNLGNFIAFTKAGVTQIGTIKEEDVTLDKTPTLDEDKPNVKLDKINDTFSIFAAANITNETRDKFVINTATGVRVNENGSDVQAWLRATLYRQEEQKMHQQIQQLLSSISSSLSTAGTQLTTAATANAGSGAAAIANFQGAASALSSVAGQFNQLAQAFQMFESRAQEYLSEAHLFSEKP